MIPMIQSNDTDVNPLETAVSSYDLSLISGVFTLGILVALLIGGKLVDAIGRKKTLIIMTSFNGVFLLVVAFASEMKLILLSRFVTGLCTGSLMSSLPIFIAEITEDHNRGKFGCIMNTFTPIGQLYCYSIGFFYSTRYMLFSVLCAIPLLISVLPFMFFIPDTPDYLLSKNKREAAVKSMKKFGVNLSLPEIEERIKKLEYTMEEERKNRSGNWKTLFSHQPSRRGFFIGLGMMLTQNGSGTGVLMSFMGPIFEEAHVSISGNVTAILVGIIKVITYFFVASIVEKSGRKFLMLVSALSCSLFLFVIGLYIFLKERDLGSYQNYSWVCVASILLFICSYSIGLGPVPSASLSELFATNVRAIGCSATSFIGQICNGILSAAFPIMTTYLGTSVCIWIFSVNCLLGAAFVFFLMPETKGKSMSEIQEMLKEKRNR